MWLKSGLIKHLCSKWLKSGLIKHLWLTKHYNYFAPLPNATATSAMTNNTCTAQEASAQLQCLFDSPRLDLASLKSLSAAMARASSTLPADLRMRQQLAQDLEHLHAALSTILAAQEAFSILRIANEPFKRTRRRLPPQAEDELSGWLRAHEDHPYMSDELVRQFSEKFGVEGEQVRVFLTNSRRKMMGGVRKRRRMM